MENREVAIQVNQIEKAYKLYDKPSDRLKEALGLSRKKRYKEHYALKGVDMTIYVPMAAIEPFISSFNSIESCLQNVFMELILAKE